MPLTEAEFQAILADPTKRIEGNILWDEDEDHSPAVEFRAEIESDAGYPLFVRGSVNRMAGTLTFAVIHRGVGRIYGLDMGKDHRNPNGQLVGETHKHRWTEQFQAKEAYVPPDINAPVTDPTAVWAQFCAEASIAHHGVLQHPPLVQGGLGIP
jgi:hypothetical protein